MRATSARAAGRLTRRRLKRRFSVVQATVVALVAAGVLAAPPARAQDRQPMAMQPVGDIVAAAEAFLRDRFRGTRQGLVPRAGTLDPRLALPECDRALEGYLPPGGKIGSRTVVGVRCTGARPWKVYVPVDVLEPRPVLVARRSLPPGHELGADDLALEERDVSRLVGGYLEDPGKAVGRRLGRAVAAGAVLAPGALEETLLVRRGQSVTLVVRQGALAIRMAGLALADGVEDERIRVRNTASDRIVEGIVRSRQEVEVLVR